MIKKNSQNKLAFLEMSGMTYLHSGLTMAFSILLWMGAGYWLDKHFNSKPVFFIIGIVMGMISVFYELYKMVKQAEKEERGENKS